MSNSEDATFPSGTKGSRRRSRPNKYLMESSDDDVDDDTSESEVSGSKRSSARLAETKKLKKSRNAKNNDNDRNKASTRTSKAQDKTKVVNESNKDDSAYASTSQGSKRPQKVQTDNQAPMQSVVKELKTIAKLPDDRCLTKVLLLSHTFKWTLENFSLISLKKPGEAVESSAFRMPKLLNLTCQLLLYPNGHCDKCKNAVCIFIRISDENSLELDYKLKLLNTKEMELSNRTCVEKESLGACDVVKKDQLLSLIDEDDTVVIRFSVTVNPRSTCKNSTSNAYSLDESQIQLEVLEDLYKFLEIKEFCDLSLCKEKEAFFAHKCILAASSPLFEKQFNNDAVEKDQAIEIINVDDFDSSVLREMIRFLYTGKISDIKTFSYRLFEIGCRFELTLLKDMCQTYFKKNLSLDNAIDVFNIADKHGVSNLKQVAINFIAAHINSFLDSPDLSKQLTHKLMVEVMKK